MGVSQTLLVFEMNPEELHFYLVDTDSKQAKAARKIAGKMSGADDFSDLEDKAFNALNNWFTSDDGKAARRGSPHIRGVSIAEVIHFGTLL